MSLCCKLVSFFFKIQTEFSMFVKHESAGELGTSRASMNRTGKTNAAKGIEKNYKIYIKNFRN